MSTKIVKKKKYRFLRRTLRILFGILIFLALLILFIRSPWGQDIIVDKVVNYVSDKTNTEVAVEKLFVTFDGDVQLNGLYLEDEKGDTLIYSKSLEANIPLWGMIKGDAIGVDDLEWEGLRANIIRKDTVSGYNFQFLIDAFSSGNTNSVVQDSTAKPFNIVVGSLNLKDIDVDFKDDVLAIDSKFQVGTLTAEMEAIDIEKMIFKVNDIQLSDAKIKYIQNPITIVLPFEEIPLPILSSESITIKNTAAYYKSNVDDILLDADLKDFYAEIPELNLVEKKFILNTVQLKNSEILVRMKSYPENGSTTATTNTSSTLLWPAIELELHNLALENNTFKYFLNDAVLQKNVFNPNAISLQNLNLNATDIFLKEQQAGLQLKQFNFNEYTNLNLKKLAFDAKVTDNKLTIRNLELALNDNKIVGAIEMRYNSLPQLLEAPETTNVRVNLPSFEFWLTEAFKFQPALQKNEYLKKLSAKKIYGNLNATGTLASIELNSTNINWGKFTQISAVGSIKNSTKQALLQVNIPNFKMESKREDILQLVDESQLNVRLPEDLLLTGSITGSLDAIATDAKLTTTQGEATVKGTFKNTDKISYDLTVKIEDYNVGTLLKNPKFGNLSLTLNSKGSGKTINNLDATLKTNISKFQLKDYAIRDLSVSGDFKDGKGNVTSKYKDNNLNVDLNAFVDLDSIATKANLNLNVIGADLEGLGFMNRNVKTGMDLSLNFKGNLEKYAVKSTIKNGVVVYDDRTYLLGPLNANAFVDKDTTALIVKNKMLDLNLQSNVDPQTFGKALQRHIFSYFYRDAIIPDTIANPVDLQLKAKISQTPLIKDVFLVNIKDLDTIKIGVDFKELDRKLVANITAPHINYSGNELDSLAFSMNTDKDNFNFNLGFKNITAGPLDVPKTIITGNQKNNELALNFLGFHEGKKLMNVNTSITGSRERLKFTVNNKDLVLNKHKWEIPETNEIILTDSVISFSDFRITKGNQSIEVTDKSPDIQKNHIAVNYKNFAISEVFNYLNPEKQITTGILSGDFVLEQPFGDTGIIADLDISQLKVLNTDFGNLSMNAKSLGYSNYDFNVNLKGGDINLDIKGDYFVSNNEANLNLDVLINEFKMKALNTLSLGEIKETSGSFSGGFKVTGTTTTPKYKGNLKFTNADFNITKLNTKFTLKNETIHIDNSGLSMSNFTVLDAKKNALVLSGTIKTESFVNPTFDLKVKANNFRILNASKEDNPSLYGKASFNANARLTGDLQIPKLNAEVTLGSDTNVTYVIPSIYANVEEREGIVEFVNRENPNAILTQTEEQTATITGFDIFSRIKINKEAAVTIIINEETEDNFKVSGEGDFIFTMIPNGRLSLTGAYEISEGHYELNLYNLVNRKFSLASGSRVSWSGDPFDAKLDVRAIYNIETSASPLMASQISGEDTAVRNRYKQVLPFNVYLNIDGELLQPKISFSLNMPEDEQGAIGGQVYGRLQQVNQQEDELNRQVFSLLVLNRFYPDAGSDGSAGGFATIARDNLNDAVSGQLNAFSDKILGGSGIELDFGLNSFTDYQGDAPTDRTQLDIAAQKKLFNERLTVRVGSEVDIQGSSANGETTPLIGNVSLEYKITEDGRYRIRGFRKSEFENVIDGQTIVSGLALIFTKEFNEFSQLWDAILRSQRAKKEAEEAQKAAKVKEVNKEKVNTKKKTN
ncbi:translocation/assembly module TamB [uncultured Polaribacter sp.]|uniref:translocation/assembly module TamB domain-containing protein n=1 Tax=uncultured Polaribacter sp. TaxID=174711 RepID=UPI0026331E2D|nr:translocation/assembly module TamB [uncultured Polaribacter sp.]